jgi:hypothetical protein
MSTDEFIHDWSDAYLELKHRAESIRGWVELNSDTPDWIRWPRTTSADVIAIAALLDPHVRQLRSSPATLRRWTACMHDVSRFALKAPGDTYPENRSFWSCLVLACVHLASVEAPLPDPTSWNALIAALGHVLALRNVGPKGDTPFKRFDGVKTFDELFVAQLKYLGELRGTDRMKPEPGMTGAEKAIPRSTNADAVLLADYWSKQLSGVKQVMGHAGVVKTWKAALADIDKLARKADPKSMYPKNNGFWRALQQTAIQVAVADEQPTKWDLAIDSIKDSVKNIGGNVADGAKTVAAGAADLASDIGHGIGKVANQAGKGLFAGFGTPLLVGGGLLGLFLISRARKGNKE